MILEHVIFVIDLPVEYDGSVLHSENGTLFQFLKTVANFSSVLFLCHFLSNIMARVIRDALSIRAKIINNLLKLLIDQTQTARPMLSLSCCNLLAVLSISFLMCNFFALFSVRWLSLICSCSFRSNSPTYFNAEIISYSLDEKHGAVYFTILFLPLYKFFKMEVSVSNLSSATVFTENLCFT